MENKIYTTEIEGFTVERWFSNNCESAHIFNDFLDVWYTDDIEDYSFICDFHMGYEETQYTITVKTAGKCDVLRVREIIAENIAIAMVRSRVQCVFSYEWKQIKKQCDKLIDIMIGK